MKTLILNRERAFDAQGGRCYYCKCAMWRGRGCADFCRRHALTTSQASGLQSTAEHLLARCEGGRDVACNIVAACRRCNGGRHKQKAVLEPAAFVRFVERRVTLEKWHIVDPGSHGLRPA